jgi:hypothetical protein
MSKSLCKFGEGCDKQPSFNYKDESKGIFCLKHKEKDMINVTNKKCEFKNCYTQPCYNYKGEPKGIFCLKHKEKDMVNVKTNPCRYEDCDKQPCFNHKGETKGIFCSEHKEKDMINVKDKKCESEEDCNIIASYNIRGLKPIFCDKHKKEDMVNVRDKKCKFEGGCENIPLYNYNGSKTGILCFEHKKEDMINVRTKTCEFSGGCGIQPCYNFPKEKTPRFCTKHKTSGMINVTHTKCLTNLCDTVVHNKLKFKGYCFRCFIYSFPEDVNVRNFKTKEKSVSDFIIQSYKDKTWITDKQILDGCSKKRPDLFCDLGDQIIIVEIDENQHKRYDCSCENKRLMEISQDVGFRPIVFIRFNPDSYFDKDGNKIKSCWTLDKKDIHRLTRENFKKWDKKLNFLKETIDYWLENKTDKTIEIIELFFDQNLK